MAKKKTNKQPWSSSLKSREALYKGVNPSADFGPLSIATQTIGYLGGFRTGQGMPEDEARWAAYLGLPYDKTYAPDTKIRFEGDENYPDRQYQGLSKRAKKEIREKIIPQAKRIKDNYNKEWIQVLDTKPNSEYNDATIYHSRQNYLGDLGKFGIREVGESGIYEVGDKYDFPALIPIPNRNEGTELMVRDTIWSDRANPKLYNKEIIKRKNKHSIGGLLGKLGDWNTNVTNNMFTNSSTGQATGFGKLAKGFGINSGNIGGLANTAATAIGGAIAGGLSSGVGNAMQSIGSLASNIPGVGGLIGAGVNLLGGVVNRAFGSKLNQEQIANIQNSTTQALNFTSNAGDFDALSSNYKSLQGVIGFDKDDVGKDGWFSNKAKRKYEELKRQAEEAEQFQQNTLANNAVNITNTTNQNLLANYSAYGGIINRFDNGGNTESIYDTAVKIRNKYRSLTGKPNEFLDTWNQVRLNTGRFDSQLGGGLMEAQKESRDSAPVFDALNTYSNVSAFRGVPLFIFGNETPEEAVNRFKGELTYQAKKIHDRIISNKKEQGEYNKDSHTIFYDPMGQNPMSTLLHEQSHASKAKPQESVIKDIILKNKEYNDTYKDDESEIYSRLMQVREANQIDPNKVWDKESLKEFKKTATDFNFLNRYSDDTILDIFNNVAANDLPKDNGLFPDLGFESHLAAYGGSIHIKPSKRGTFTAAATKHGMGVQEFASKVLANKEDYSPAMVKKANFARNASKWKHADGGELFTNGVITVGNGGTHEDNPYEGVQIGVDPQGIPNLVEEGEVIYDDYVFSNRLRVPKEVRQKYKLRGVTFADVAKQLQKESEERPNDPISKNGLDASMSMLQQEQEAVRMKKESNKYAKGGKLGKLYAGTGPYSNYLDSEEYDEDNIVGYTKRGALMDDGNIVSFTDIPEVVTSRTVTGNTTNGNGNTTNKSSNSNWLRYAPIAGHAIGAFSDLFSSPDYSAAETIEAVDITPATVGYTPVGNYLSYKPFDKDYYLNKLNADSAASRRAITNTSGGNRAAAMAGLLAADYNYGNQLGALSRQAEEYNQALRERVEGFNRQTNLANSEMGLKAAMANVESRNQATKLRLSQAGQVAAMRKAAKDAYDARRSNNINVLLEELGGLGTENWNRDWLDRLAKAGVLKIDSKGNPVISSAKGGKIRTKKKKGFTYG